MPDPSVLRHTCVWCRDRIEPDELSITFDPDEDKAYFEHRDRCPSEMA